MPRAAIARRTAAQRRSSSPMEMRVATRSVSVIFGPSGFVDDAVAQRADARDLDLEYIAGLHPERRIAAVADAFRRAGRDHIARRKLREVGAERDDLRDRIYQKVRSRALHLRAVEARREHEASRIGNFVAGDEERAERSGAREILAGGDGEFLIVAHAAVHKARVAGNVIERSLDRNMPPAAANHHRELALEVEMRRDFGADHLAFMSDQRVGAADEHARLLGDVAPGLARMRAIVDAGTGDELRVGNDGQEGYVGELAIGARLGGRGGDLRDEVLRQRLLEARDADAWTPAHGDDAVVAHHAERGAAVNQIACELHSRNLPGTAA